MHTFYLNTIVGTLSVYLLEELFDGRHQLLQRLALVGGERVGVGEHLRGLEAAAEQVERERVAVTRRRRRRASRPAHTHCLTDLT